MRGLGRHLHGPGLSKLPGWLRAARPGTAARETHPRHDSAFERQEGHRDCGQVRCPLLHHRPAGQARPRGDRDDRCVGVAADPVLAEHPGGRPARPGPACSAGHRPQRRLSPLDRCRAAAPARAAHDQAKGVPVTVQRSPRSRPRPTASSRTSPTHSRAATSMRRFPPTSLPLSAVFLLIGRAAQAPLAVRQSGAGSRGRSRAGRGRSAARPGRRAVRRDRQAAGGSGRCLLEWAVGPHWLRQRAPAEGRLIPPVEYEALHRSTALPEPPAQRHFGVSIEPGT
jgi:hypothetical protein